MDRRDWDQVRTISGGLGSSHCNVMRAGAELEKGAAWEGDEEQEDEVMGRAGLDHRKRAFGAGMLYRAVLDAGAGRDARGLSSSVTADVDATRWSTSFEAGAAVDVSSHSSAPAGPASSRCCCCVACLDVCG